MNHLLYDLGMDATSDARHSSLSRVGDPDLVARRQQQLADAATRLLSRQLFAKTVVRDIAKEAGMSVGLVYEYIRTKEDILRLIFDHWSQITTQRLAEACADDGRAGHERLRASVEYLVVEVAGDRPDSVHVVYRDMGNLDAAGLEIQKAGERVLVEMLSEILKVCIAEGSVDKSVDAELAAVTLLYLSHGWALKGYILHDRHTPASYVDWILSSVGFFASKSPEARL